MGKRNTGKTLNGNPSKSISSDNPHRKLSKPIGKGGGKLRDKATIERLNMYRGGKPIRDRRGRVVGGELMMGDTAGGTKIAASTGRVQPDRRWFGNTRTIKPAELDKFREQMRTAAANPMSVVLRRRKLPMGLMLDGTRATHASATATAAALSDGAIGGAPDLERLKSVELLSSEPFERVFAKGRPRKRPRLLEDVDSLESVVARAAAAGRDYDDRNSMGSSAPVASQRADTAALSVPTEFQGGNEGASANRRELKKVKEVHDARRDDMFAKGQSRRIWGELHKVLDCSDVVLHVLDARDVEGTRCRAVETHLRKHAQQKHLIFVLNKCDLVPNWVTRRWVKQLSSECVVERSQSARTPRTSRLVPHHISSRAHRYPTLAFHASLTNSFGKGSVINLLRQYAKLHTDRKQISVRARAWRRARLPAQALRSQRRAVGWRDRVPERGQVVADQHVAHQESVQDGACARRDQSLAVHRSHATHPFDRLPRDRARRGRRDGGGGLSASGRRARGTPAGPD